MKALEGNPTRGLRNLQREQIVQLQPYDYIKFVQENKNLTKKLDLFSEEECESEEYDHSED